MRTSRPALGLLLFALAPLVFAGCSAATGATCPSTQTLTYANFGQTFMLAYCLRCHSAARTGADRKSAPVGVDYDTAEGIRAHMKLMDEYAGSGPNGTNTWMPPSDPTPSTAERAQLAEWLACGAP